MSKHVFVVLTNAAAGREDEFNAWYNKVHIPQVLQIPGIVGAQPFTLSDVQRIDPPYLYKYLALYDIDTDNLQETMSTLKKRVETGEVVMSDALSANRVSWIYHPITEKAVAKGTK